MSLIDELRREAGIGTADYTLAGSAYWTDAQLAEALRQRRRLYMEEPIEWMPQNVGGGTKSYMVGFVDFPGRVEPGTAGGTAISASPVTTVLDSNGGTVTGWSLEADGMIVFGADTGGSAFTLTAWAYDVTSAAADVCERYAAHVSDEFDFATDDQTFNRSQRHAQLLAQAARLRSRAAGAFGDAQMIRSDLNPQRR